MTVAKPKSDETAPPAQIRLQRIEITTLQVALEGVTPVIPHKWSQKAINMMAAKQQAPAGSAKPAREPKNAEEEAHAACYWLPDGVTPGIPATAFKAAMVGACRFFTGITMTLAKTLFYVEGVGPDQLVAIEGERTLREDTPRNANGGADLRYRFAYYPWSTTINVRFKPASIDAESVVALLDAGGSGGVGDWRPASPKSATGTFGQFRVV